MIRAWSLGALAVAILLLTGSSAHATPTLDVSSSSELTWINATTTEASDGLEIKIRAPKLKSRGRVLWQTCRFSGSTPGTYRCGIDTSKGSLAQNREGRWVAKVFAGGVQVARTAFTI